MITKHQMNLPSFVLKMLHSTLVLNVFNAIPFSMLKPKHAKNVKVKIIMILKLILAIWTKLQSPILMQEKVHLSFLMIKLSMTFLKAIKNWSKTIKLLFVKAINLISMILNVFHAQRGLTFPWLKKAVELVSLALFSTKIQIIVKRSHITQILKIQTGQVKKLIQKLKKSCNNYQKILFIRNVQLINHFQLERNVSNAITMNILTLIKRNAISVIMDKFSIKIFITVRILKTISKQIQKKLQIWSLKADQRMNGCTFTTKILKRTMEWQIVPLKCHSLMD